MSNQEISEKFTWADLKAAVNEVPDDQLNDQVILWEEERGVKVGGVLILEEDYVKTDDDTLCAPKSDVVDTNEGWNEIENPVVYKAGKMILFEDI
jgi:hypothetical protein